jgi:hypothetical protein
MLLHGFRVERYLMKASWRPEDKQGAAIFSIDDVHPGTRHTYYEAGGELSRGVLGNLQVLQREIPALSTTLFVTPAWREISPMPTYRFRSKVPLLRNNLYLSPIRRRDAMRIDKYPEFVSFLMSLPRTEVAIHGLYHVSRGSNIPQEAWGACLDQAYA